MCFFYNFIRFLRFYALFLQPERVKNEQSVTLTLLKMTQI